MGLVEQATSFYIDSYIGALEKQASFGQEATNILSVAGGGESVQSNLFSTAIGAMIDNVLPVMQGIAIAIALTYTFIGLIGLAKNDSLTPEILIKHFSKFAAAFGIIMLSDNLLPLFIGLGEFAMRVVSVLGVSPPDLDPDAAGSKVQVMRASLEELFKVIKGMKGGNFSGSAAAMLLYMSGFGFWIQNVVSWIGSMVIFFAALTRGLELGVRSVFMPVAVASFGEGGGWNGAGGRFIKRYLAVATQGAVIVAGVKVTRMFVSAQYDHAINESLRLAKELSAEMDFINGATESLASFATFSDNVAKAAMESSGLTAEKIKDVLENPSSFPSFVGTYSEYNSTYTSWMTSILALRFSPNPAYTAVCQLHDVQSKTIWTTIAVTFAGLGLVAKALQVSNDVWGA